MFRVALQAVQIVHVDGVQVAEQHHQNGQTNGGLGSRYSQNKEYEYLSGGITQIMRERNEIHIHCQQHQFDGHQQNDHVLAIQKDAYHADCEQQGTQNQEMRKRQHVDPLYS